MSIPFAYECYADRNVARFLREEIGLPLELLHRSGQGEVINTVLSGDGSKIGLIDEDPDKTHHRKRAEMRMAADGARIQLLELQGRFVMVLKPWLERAFVDDMSAQGLTSALGKDPLAIRSWLGTPGGPEHEKFFEDLRRLHAHSKRPGSPTSFLAELETAIRDILTMLDARGHS